MTVLRIEVSGLRVTRAVCVCGYRIRAAMRPGVITRDGQATRHAALKGKNERVVTGRGAAVDSIHRTKIFSDLRILESQHPSLIGSLRCRTLLVLHAGQGART